MWARLVSAAMGAFFMASPGMFGYGGAAAFSDHVAGPIVFASSFVASWPALRSLRLISLPIGLWILVAPVLMEYEAHGSTIPDVVYVLGGLGLAILAFVGAGTTGSFGGGWSAAWPLSKREARGRVQATGTGGDGA